MPIFASISAMTILLWMNMLTALGIADAAGMMVLPDLTIARVIISIGCIAAALYFLLVYNGKSNLMINSLDGESKKSNLIGTIVVVAYILLSIFSVTIGFYFMGLWKDAHGLK